MSRDSSIDVSKGLVIILVVLGHVFEGLVLQGARGSWADISYQTIYLFHMPFWFLLSGYLLKGAQEPCAYFRKKFGHLMVPYFGWLLVFNLPVLAGFFGNLVRGSMNDERWSFYVSKFGDQLYGGNAVHGAQMILWFPTCLFFTQQLGNWLFHRVENRVLLAVIGLVSMGLGYVNQYYFPEFHLPLALNVVAGALPFFLLGSCMRRALDYPVLKWGSAGCFVAAASAMVAWQIPAFYHMRMAWYGIPVLSTLAGIGGFVVVLALARMISSSGRLTRMLVTVGSASMTIMYIHAVVLVKAHEIGVSHFVLRAVLAVVIPVVVHYLLIRNRWTSLLMLGQKKIERAG